MAIKKILGDIVIKYPSGSGLSNQPCPSCGEPGYSVQYGMDKEEKPYYKAYCFNCKWSNSLEKNKE